MWNKKKLREEIRYYSEWLTSFSSNLEEREKKDMSVDVLSRKPPLFVYFSPWLDNISLFSSRTARTYLYCSLEPSKVLQKNPFRTIKSSPKASVLCKKL